MLRSLSFQALSVRRLSAETLELENKTEPSNWKIFIAKEAMVILIAKTETLELEE